MTTTETVTEPVVAPAKEVKAKKAPAAKKEKAKVKKLPAAKKEVKPKAEKAPKVVKEKKVKEPKAPKEPPAPKTITDYQKDGVSGLVRKMLTPTDGTKVAGCTYGEANKAVKKKFPERAETGLYASEFDRNFKVLAALGIVETKKPPHFKTVEETKKEKKAPAKKEKKEKAVPTPVEVKTDEVLEA